MGGVPLPEGYHSVNPYIVVDDAERLIDFLVEVFGAVEQGRSLRPDGRIDHGDIRIGDSLVMLSEASEAYPARPCVHFVYVPDVDATYRAALAAGATSILEPTEQSWGDRVCGFVDPFDNRWWVGNPSAGVLLDPRASDYESDGLDDQTDDQRSNPSGAPSARPRASGDRPQPQRD
jgi:PhnB protein